MSTRNPGNIERQSTKMRKAIDDLFKKMDSKGSNFLNNFEKTITDVSKKHRVLREKTL